MSRVGKAPIPVPGDVKVALANEKPDTRVGAIAHAPEAAFPMTKGNKSLQDALNANPPAAKFFATLKGANRYAILYRIGSVTRPETRARKIAEYVAMLERGETIHG